MAWTYRRIARRDLLSAVRRHFDNQALNQICGKWNNRTTNDCYIRGVFVTHASVAAVASVVTSVYVVWAFEDDARGSSKELHSEVYTDIDEELKRRKQLYDGAMIQGLRLWI